jgi:hypothetical protein
VQYDGDGIIDSVKWGTTKLTKLAANGGYFGYENVEAWYLKNPTAGQDSLRVWSSEGTQESSSGEMFAFLHLSNVDQTNTFDDNNNGTISNDSIATNVVTTNRSGDMGVIVAALGVAEVPYPITHGTDQNGISVYEAAGVANAGSSWKRSTGSSVTLSEYFGGKSYGVWIAFSIRRAQ